MSKSTYKKWIKESFLYEVDKYGSKIVIIISLIGLIFSSSIILFTYSKSLLSRRRDGSYVRYSQGI